jgi:hypothetical protein
MISLKSKNIVILQNTTKYLFLDLKIFFFVRFAGRTAQSARGL